MDLSGCLIAQRLVWPFIVVEAEVAVEAVVGIRDRLIVVQVHLLPFDRAPEPLDEDVIEGASPSIPTDLDTRLFQPPGIGGAGELD